MVEKAPLLFPHEDTFCTEAEGGASCLLLRAPSPQPSACTRARRSATHAALLGTAELPNGTAYPLAEPLVRSPTTTVAALALALTLTLALAFTLALAPTLSRCSVACGTTRARAARRR